MSGVSILKTLLHANGALTAVVPVAQIVGGVLPQAITLPAISVMEVVATEVPTIDAFAPSTIVESRVRVTVVAGAYATMKTVLALARKACNYQRGVLAGLTVVSVRRASSGPDLSEEAADLCMQSIDFLVLYYEPN